MAQNSKIEWTDHTFNAWVGCTKVSGACDFCYAEAWAKRAGRSDLWNGKRARTTEVYWRQPIKWNAVAEKAGKRARVFCCSLADVFDNQAEPRWRADLFALIRATPWLEWQLLTKRPQNIVKMCEAAGGLPPNAALGTTTENQEEADRRIPKLLEAAAKLHPLYTFISAEPLIGPVTLHPTWLRCPDCKGRGYYLPSFAANYFVSCENCIKWARAGGLTILPGQQATPRSRLDWVICGGESGGQARPMHSDWAQSLRDQCAAAGVPFFFKQWGEWTPGVNCGDPPTRTERVAEWWDGKWTFSTLTPRISEETHIDDEPDVYRIGKKRAGRHLDGIEHNGMPEPRTP